MAAKSEPIPRYRPFDGPVLFRQGFRPFFLGAGIWSFAAVAVWIPLFQGDMALPTAFGPLAWHAHEMIFGFVAAVVTGFLLTAVPNWTGRMPLQGPALMALFAIWAAGRIAVWVSETIGAGLAAAIDLLFLAALFAVVLREIAAGRHWQSLPFPAALVVLFGANALMHAEALGWAATGRLGGRLGVAVIIALISLIGGRIIPSFTRNWLIKRGETQTPASFSGFDRLCLLAVAAALAVWAFAPEGDVTAVLLLLAGALSLARLARWRGLRTGAEPLVWSLHLAFLWVPVGLVLTGLSAWGAGVPLSAGLHALTAGAMGGMTLAVMTRATRGHTGRELAADPATTLIYLLVFAAALARVAAPFDADVYMPLLVVSAVLWCAAFAIFGVHYGRMLTTLAARTEAPQQPR